MATSQSCSEPSQQGLLLLRSSAVLPALTCSPQAVLQWQHTVLSEQQTKQRLSSSTGMWCFLAQLRPLTTTALPGDAWPQWGYRASWRQRVTEATFWFLAEDESRVSSCAVPLALQVREETRLLNWLAQIWLKESFLGWIQGFEVTLTQ